VLFKANKMAVNVNKTNYIIFHTGGKPTNLNGCDISFDLNYTNVNPPDPALIQKIERIHNKHSDPKMQSFKLLGVFLDEHLYILNRVKQFLSPSSLRKLYFSFFHSNLLYCIHSKLYLTD
jgi:hypothetical protein